MSTRSALLFSFVDRYASLLVNIGSTVVIARLLSPAELGVFSVTMALTISVAAIRDFGAGQYLVQEAELTEARIRAAWTVLVLTGVGLSIVTAVASGPVAAFYAEPRMKSIMLVLSLNFAINPVGSLVYAWLMRAMRFRAIAVMRFASVLAGAVVSVGLAYLDRGPISLALGSLASTVVTAAAALWLRPPGFNLALGFSEAKRVMGFGGKISLSSIVGVLTASAPELALGKLQSVAAAAYFSRANGLCSLFHRLVVDAVSAVALPMLAEEARRGASIAASFVRAQSFLTALGWSFFLGLAWIADPVVTLLYGNQWDDSVLPTRLLAVAFSLSLPTVLCPVALMSMGRAGEVVRGALATAVIYVVAVVSGATHGLTYTAALTLVASTINLGVWLEIARRQILFRWADIGKALARSLAVAVIASLAPAAVVGFAGLDPANNLIAVLMAGFGGGALLYAGLIVCRHPLADEVHRALRALVTSLRRKPV